MMQFYTNTLLKIAMINQLLLKESKNNHNSINTCDHGCNYVPMKPLKTLLSIRSTIHGFALLVHSYAFGFFSMKDKSFPLDSNTESSGNRQDCFIKFCIKF